MPVYKFKAYRRQLVEITVEAQDEEYAWDIACRCGVDDWSVEDTYEVEEYADCEQVDIYEDYDND